MSPDIHKLLLSIDDDGFEVPGNDWGAFRYQELSESVVRIGERIRAEMGIELRRDGNVQDASLHDRLSVRPLVESSRGRCSPLCISFSNFGRLFTIHGPDREILATFPLERVRRLAEEEGWVYVPADELGEPYDGVNAPLRDAGMSWWRRYFDYL